MVRKTGSAGANLVVLFSSDDVVPNIILNHALGAMRDMGLDPLVFQTPLLVHKAPPPSLEKMAFYEREILYEWVFPELESQAEPGKDRGQGMMTFNELREAFGGFERIDHLDDPKVAQAFDHPAFLGAISAHNQLLFRGRHIDHVRRRGGFLWNLHHGPLPDNRGLLAPFWNLLEGRNAHGVSLHEIDPGIDTGALIVTARLRLSRQQSVLASLIDLGVPGAHLLVQTLRRVVGGMPVLSVPQDPAEGVYRSYPCEEDADQGRSRGIHLTGGPMEMAALYADLYGLSERFVADTLLPALRRYEEAWLFRASTHVPCTREVSCPQPLGVTSIAGRKSLG